MAQKQLNQSGSNHFEDCLDFNGCVFGKASYGYRGACVSPAFTENIDHEVGGTVDDGRAICETGHGVDKTIELHHLIHFIEVTEGVFRDGQQIQGTHSGRFLAVGDVAGFTDFTSMGHLAVDKANGSGNIENLTDLNGSNVVACWHWCDWEFDAEFGEALIRSHVKKIKYTKFKSRLQDFNLIFERKVFHLQCWR